MIPVVFRRAVRVMGMIQRGSGGLPRPTRVAWPNKTTPESGKVCVGVLVSVFVGTGVLVWVGTSVGVSLGVGVSVGVSVCVGVSVDVGVSVETGTSVSVDVGVSVSNGATSLALTCADTGSEIRALSRAKAGFAEYVTAMLRLIPSKSPIIDNASNLVCHWRTGWQALNVYASDVGARRESSFYSYSLALFPT